MAKTSSLPGGTPYVRTIRAPDANATVKVSGVVAAPTISQANGSVTFSTAPADGAALTWSGSYHLVMRFDADELTATIFNRFSDSYALSGTCDLLESFEDAV